MPIIRRNRSGPPPLPQMVVHAETRGPEIEESFLPDGATPAPAAVTAKPITAIANQANACLGLVGITGSGKTSLAVTAVEEAWEVYQRITRWYASDLGGFGNKLLALVRLGICQIWYIRNHHNAFTTMDLASQGYWPVLIQDRETGFAAPDVALVPPRVVKFQIVCPNNHPVASYADPSQVALAQQACPTCGTITSAGNALRVDRVVVRSAGFKNVGHYVFDSMSQMSEWGAIDLRGKSARGELPSGSSGGSALGSADAVREAGGAVFGTGSKAQVGFMQDRVPVWLGNIRAIPDMVLPPVVTFGVERSKGDDESGGIPIFGPKIAGNARTSQVPGWLGNCLYAAKEPHNPVEVDDHGNVKLYHRLWLTNHIDPRDNSNTPIVAKHRGEPLGMPDMLEDSGEPADAWKVCSLRMFYKLLREQSVLIEQRTKAQFPNAPGLQADAEADADEVLEIQPMGGAGAGPTSVAVVGRQIRRRQRTVVENPAAAVVETAIDAPPAEKESVATESVNPPVEATTAPKPEAPPPIVEQLQASLDAAAATASQMAAPAGNGAVATPTPGGGSVAPPAAIVHPVQQAAEILAAAAPPAATSTAAPPRATGSVNRIRRVARPPAE